MKRVHLIISGDVQGVGFRAWMCNQARALDLTGWVKNRKDGAVEAVGEGENARLVKFINLARKGPDVAWIEDISVKWEKATGQFAGFAISF